MKMSPASRALSEGRSSRLGVRNDEAESIAVHGEPARDQILVGSRSGAERIDPINRKKLSARHQLLQQVIKFAPLVPVQAEFTHELLESRSTLGLPRDIFQDCRIREHRSCRLSAVSFQLNASRAFTNQQLDYHVSPPPRGGHAPSARRINAICPT